MGKWRLLAVLGLFFMAMTAAYGQDRGLSVQAQTLVRNANFNVGKQFAVIIGIDRYTEWTPLRNAVRDAKAIKTILAERYYIDEFIELYDAQATASNIRRLFTDELPSKVGPADSVFIYYAGHGYLDNTNTGFWIGVDGSKDTFSQNGWIGNQQIRNAIANLKATRVLVAADSCFSGDLINVSRGAAPVVNDAYFARALQLTARQVLTSGASETVPDESQFALGFRTALLRNNDTILDPHSIFERIRGNVTQTVPLYGTLPGGESGGTFAFFLRPQTGQVSVTVATEGRVFVGGVESGLASPARPVVLSGLPAGAVEVKILYTGFEEKQTITVLPSQVNPIAFTYKPAPMVSQLGAVEFVNYPDGAVVLFGGRELGVVAGGRLVVENLNPGPRSFEVLHPNWPEPLVVNTSIQAGSSLRQGFEGGSLVLSGIPSGVRVTINGKAMSSNLLVGSNLAINDLPSGLYRIGATGDGFVDYRGEVLVSTGQRSALTLNIQKTPMVVTPVAPQITQLPSNTNQAALADLQQQLYYLEARRRDMGGAGLQTGNVAAWIGAGLGAVASTAFYIRSGTLLTEYDAASTVEDASRLRSDIIANNDLFSISVSVTGLSAITGLITGLLKPNTRDVDSQIQDINRQIRQLRGAQ